MKPDILAVFDLDGTLTANGPLEKTFGKYLLQEGHLHFTPILLSAAYVLIMLPFDHVSAIKRNKIYLRGMTECCFKVAVEEFTTLYKNLLADNTRFLFESHKRLNHTTILITGSLDLLVTRLFNQLQLPVDQIYATALSVKDEKLTGMIQGCHYYGETKAKLVEEIAARSGADLSGSFCYADSFSDIPMMELFGNPVAVNPDKKLAAVAKKRFWKILDSNLE